MENINNKCKDKTRLKHSTTKKIPSRAYKICTEKHLQSEIDFLIDIFTDNGNNRNTLTNIATEYLRNNNKPKSNAQNNTKNTKSIIKLPWVLILGPKLRKKIKKKGIKTVFTSGANLESILCQISLKLYLILTWAFIH